MCVPPNGETSAPYGIDNSSLAGQTYAGCALGYTYNDGFQCCQAMTGGSYPACAPGYTFSSDLGVCAPAVVGELGGEGCVTVRVNTLKCSNIEDKVCAPIDSESRCVAETTCRWDEFTNSLCTQIKIYSSRSKKTGWFDVSNQPVFLYLCIYFQADDKWVIFSAIPLRKGGVIIFIVCRQNYY